MIFVLGWYGHRNIGDESYSYTFPKIFPQQKLVFSDGVPPVHEPLIVGGGDILKESFLQKTVSVQAPKIVLSASANIQSPWHFLESFSQIFVRDFYSVKLLEEHGLPSRFVPDAAFLLKPNKKNGEALLKSIARRENVKLYQKKIGVVFNSYLMFPGNPSFLARDFLSLQKVSSDLAKICDSTTASFVFVPMCTSMPNDDRISNGLIASRCKFYEKNLLVNARLSVQETLDLISSFDVLITTRLHSAIFATISGIPFIDLFHHDKSRQFLESIDMLDLAVSYWSLDVDLLKNKLDLFLDYPFDVCSRLKKVYRDQLSILEREMANVCMYK